jgi:hypothetical protein
MVSDEKILDYIDGLLSAEEAEQVREKITTDGEWTARHHSFLEMNTLLKRSELLSPSTSFVDQTIAQLETETQWSNSKTSALIKFFQVTVWLWVMIAIVVFSDINISVVSNAIQQWIIGLSSLSKSGTHLLFGSSAMLWAFGVLLMAYVAVRNYEKDANLFNEILN